MPVRMEKDSPEDSGKRSSSKTGGNLLKWLPLLLFFVIKRPKLLIPILILGGIWYFFFGGSELLSGGISAEESDIQFSLGAQLSEEKFDQAQVFEPLAYGYGGFNELPTSASLESFAPRSMHQGRQGSCVGWASAYAARTILEARANNANANEIAFSPSYLYNQIALSGCQGAYMLDAMQAMRQNGALPFDQFGYDERSCSKQPGGNVIRAGKAYRIKGYNRLTLGANNYKPDIVAIKQNLAQGAPVVIGMQVGGSFMTRMMGKDAWVPGQNDYGLRGFSGHAMCVIGYDDNRYGGAFHIMNSWGQDWGNNGKAWVRYRDFEYFVKEAYGLYPMGSSDTRKFDENRMAVEFGLLHLSTQSTIALKQKGDIVFQTVKPLRKGDKFKVLIANSIECYIHVFGQETDGSSYVLFPYTEKHSPYCGITGTRLFPKDYSMTLDQIGNKDFIAIVVTKDEIDFQELNSRMNRSRQNSYSGKLRDALADQRVSTVNFQAGNTIAFGAQLNGKNAVGMVVEIDKQ